MPQLFARRHLERGTKDRAGPPASPPDGPSPIGIAADGTVF